MSLNKYERYSGVICFCWWQFCSGETGETGRRNPGWSWQTGNAFGFWGPKIQWGKPYFWATFLFETQKVWWVMAMTWSISLLSSNFQSPSMTLLMMLRMIVPMMGWWWGRWWWGWLWWWWWWLWWFTVTELDTANDATDSADDGMKRMIWRIVMMTTA